MLGRRTCLPCHIPDRWSRNANRIWPDLAFGFVHKRSGNEINIYPFRFIAVASRRYKNWLQFEQHYSQSVFNFYFFGKKNSPANVLKHDLNSARWMPVLVSGLDVTVSARYGWSVASQSTSFPLRHCNLRNLTLQQECYLINISLDHSRSFPPAQYFRAALQCCWLVVY